MSQELTTQNEPPSDNGDLSDDDVLAFTRRFRVNVVHKLMPGADVPGDNSDRIMLNQMLEGLDRQAMGVKKLKQDQTAANNSAAVVAELLRAMDKNSAFRISPTDAQNGNIIEGDMRVVPSTISDIPALPGEMDVSPPQLDYNSFVRSQGRDVDQIGRDVKHNESEDEDDIP